MKIKLSEIINLYKQKDVDEFINRTLGYSLNDKNINKELIKNNWKFIGDNDSNASIIGVLNDPNKGIIERITNAIDAVIEKEVEINSYEGLKSVSQVIEKSYPNFFQMRKEIEQGLKFKPNPCELKNKVKLMISDGSSTTTPTVDIIDQGKGLRGEQFSSTILSLSAGNKLSTDKLYTIGAFGHGGSTSLAFAKSTIIMSKKEEKIYFTIVKKIKLSDIKTYTYVYLILDEKIPEIEIDKCAHNENYNDFFAEESGTIVRMVETEIEREYRDNDITKPGELIDYVNTELYNVFVPVKIIENRSNYIENSALQNRYANGTYLKLFTNRTYVREDYSGVIEVEFGNKIYNITYTAILPEDENEWSKDSICKSKFQQFNIHLDPIVYTVNGQYITSEKIRKLKDIGLSFLQYRLLIEINLDILETAKYDFFTTDRSQIKKNELSKGFLEKVLERIKEEKNIIELNDIIANKSISADIDKNLIDEISKNIKNKYLKYLNSTKPLSFEKTDRGNQNKDEESNYLDKILKLEVTTKSKAYKSNEMINIIVNTGAMKSVNKSSKIEVFLNGKQFFDFSESYMNGRIQYTMQNVPIGMHQIVFELIEGKDTLITSNIHEFAVVPEKLPPADNTKQKDLDLEVNLIEDSEIILDIIRNEIDKKIIVKICLNHERLVKEVYGKTASNDDIIVFKNSIIEPLVYFSLFLGDDYYNLDNLENKNEIIISLIKTLQVTRKND